MTGHRRSPGSRLLVLTSAISLLLSTMYLAAIPVLASHTITVQPYDETAHECGNDGGYKIEGEWVQEGSHTYELRDGSSNLLFSVVIDATFDDEENEWKSFSYSGATPAPDYVVLARGSGTGEQETKSYPGGASGSGLFLDSGKEISHISFCGEDEPDPQLTADVVIEKWADDDEVDAGDSFGYGLKVKNNGTGTAANVTVTDNTLDLPLIFSAPTTTQGSCAIDAANNLSCSLGDVAAGGEVTITFTAETTEDACPRVINRATVAADNDSDTSNNVSNAVTVTVNCEEEPTTPPSEDPDEDGAALNIRKVDDQGIRLAGAVFTVEGMEGTFTTGENGHFCITGLEEDSVWLVTEIQAPAGYEIADEASQLVEVDNDGDCRSPDAVFVNTLADEEESAALKIRKVDEEGNRLAGAVFEIEGMEGTFTTNAAGEFCVTGLDLDTWWTVTEIQAPAGYEIADEASQLVEADDDGDCNSPDAVFVNTLAEEEPNEEEPNTEPTPREGELGGNPTPTPGQGGTLPDTAVVSTGAPISPALGALIALASLLVLAGAQLAEVRARR